MNTSFSKKKETESKHWPCNDILSTPGRLYYSLLYYGSGVKRPFWPHRRILVTRWSRHGPPLFGFNIAKTFGFGCYMMLSFCIWLLKSSTAPNQINCKKESRLLTSHPPFNSFKLCYGLFLWERINGRWVWLWNLHPKRTPAFPALFSHPLGVDWVWQWILRSWSWIDLNWCSSTNQVIAWEITRASHLITAMSLYTPIAGQESSKWDPGWLSKLPKSGTWKYIVSLHEGW